MTRFLTYGAHIYEIIQSIGNAKIYAVPQSPKILRKCFCFEEHYARLFLIPNTNPMKTNTLNITRIPPYGPL